MTSQIAWERKTIVCDICKERPYKFTIEVSRGLWKGVCEECKPITEDKDTKQKEN